MDKQTAMQILCLQGGESDKEIKSQFRKMLHIHHPDVAGNDNPFADDMVRDLIEAYELLSGMIEPTGGMLKKEWNAPINAKAGYDRNIYAAFSLFEEESFLLEIAKGKYIWDPDEEDFEHFTKSVYNLAENLLKEHEKSTADPVTVHLFRLLLEEYIYPFYAIEKLADRTEERKDGGYRYHFTGFVTQSGNGEELQAGDKAKVRLKDTALFLQFEKSPELYKLSFDMDHLYPVIISLLKTGKAAARCEVAEKVKAKRGSSQLKVSFVISVKDKIADEPVSNKEIIERLLK